MADDAVLAPNPAELAGPWARFFAKRVDEVAVILLSVILGAVLAAVDLLTGTALLDPLMMSAPLVSFTLNALVTLALWFAYDVVSLALFGKTLGKKAMGLSVVQNGGKPGWAAAARRTALLLPLGLGLGLPVISFITGIWGYVQVENKGRTVWDRSSGTDVLGKRIGWWRWAFAILLWFVVTTAVLLGLMTRIDAIMAAG